ncbi:MAG: hypothetical protein ACREBS_02600 [Nitrososphaerales archaeon]
MLRVARSFTQFHSDARDYRIKISDLIFLQYLVVCELAVFAAGSIVKLAYSKSEYYTIHFWVSLDPYIPMQSSQRFIIIVKITATKTEVSRQTISVENPTAQPEMVLRLDSTKFGFPRSLHRRLYASRKVFIRRPAFDKFEK